MNRSLLMAGPWDANKIEVRPSCSYGQAMKVLQRNLGRIFMGRMLIQFEWSSAKGTFTLWFRNADRFDLLMEERFPKIWTGDFARMFHVLGQPLQGS